MRILVAEPDDTARELILSAIPSAYVIFEAFDGDETLAHIVQASERGNPFDLLILDLQLSSLDGIDVLTFLRGLEEPRKLAGGGKYTKVLAMSTQPKGTEIYSALVNACDGYLMKPLDKKRFTAELERLVPRL